MEKLIVKNFGAIKNIDIELKNLTIFIGKTGTGKSTLAKLIAIFRQPNFYYNAYSFEKLLLNHKINDFLQTDTYILYKSSAFSFLYNTSEKIQIGLNPQLDTVIDEYLKEKNVNYSDISEDLRKETTQYFLNQVVLQNTYIPTERMLLSIFDEGQFDENLKKILPFGLSEFGKYFKIATQKLPNYKIDMFDVSYQKVGTEDFVKLANGKMLKLSVSASGMQTAIPALLVMDYYSKDKDHKRSFVFEEPELNLFPYAQGRLVEFIAEKVLNRGHQLVICTHSDHIINTTLVLCKKLEEEGIGIDRNTTQIYFLNDDENTEQAALVPIHEGGKILYPPKGFFDKIKLDRQYLMGF